MFGAEQGSEKRRRGMRVSVTCPTWLSLHGGKTGTWNGACVSGRRQSGMARLIKQELLYLSKVQGFLLPNPAW